jgi:predicted SAM-dependent methyltransferase
MERRRPTADGPLAWVNIGCGTHNAPPPWWNVDVVTNDNTHPDEVVPRGRLPYPDRSCERVMLSHCMEHIPWGQPLLDALADYRRLLQRGGQLVAIGPDFERTAHQWKAGQATDELMFAVAEHARIPADLIGDWPEARHHWNCTEARMLMALEVAGYANVTAHPIGHAGTLMAEGWPIVAPADWQALVTAEVAP